jgi:L-2-hydroxyglutarate oxidase
MYDFILIGGGIVGVSTALQLQQRHPGADILLIEKETSLALHQTGRNSGVVHAGVYYQPGSLKAEFCKQGAALTAEFCLAHGLPYEKCGKLLVATDETEYERMHALEQRCRENDIDIQRLSARELKTREPNINGVGALYVPGTGITDYRKITVEMARQLRMLGGKIKMGQAVRGICEEKSGVRILAGKDEVKGRWVITCGGLLADRLVRMMGIDTDFQIMPFRGEYYRLSARHNHIVNHLIYPIPDPDLPFLGVHLTRMIDGSVTIGPNAVMGWKREGYGRINIDVRDVFDMLCFPGFWKVVCEHLGSGLGEMRDSFYAPGYLKRVHKYCSHIRLADLSPYPAGIRAQAVTVRGNLVHDFLFAESERSLHVCNAPSPAATSAVPIGAYICDRLDEKVNA